MACPAGQHQHIGADGKRMLRCHPISEKHTNPTAQNYHQMALQQGKGKEKELAGGVDNGYDESVIPKEQSERIKANLVVIRRNLTKLMNNPRLKNLLIPLSAGLIAYDGLVQSATKYKAKAKSKQEKAMADTYAKTVEEIMDGMPDMDKDLGADAFVKLKTDCKEKVDALVAVIKEKGKNCPEYAQYRAYKDFMSLCDEKTLALLNRVDDAENPTSDEDKAQMLFGSEIKGRRVRGATRSKPAPA